MKKILVLISMFIISSAFGQQNCSCNKAIDNLISKIEKEYPGFVEKTKDTLIYNSLKKQLIAEAEKTEDSLCIDILTKYTSFFKDKHIWMLPSNNPVGSNGHIDKDLIDLNLDKFYRKLKKSKDMLEGVWQYQNNLVGIVKSKGGNYYGFIIKADSSYGKPMEIKFVLNEDNSADYYFSSQIYKGNYQLHHDRILYIEPLKIAFVKEVGGQKEDSIKIQREIDVLDGFYIRNLSARTNLLRISSFNYPYVDRINSLIEENRELIQNGENLIIDLRGNGGGTDNAYKSLLPYISTNPIRYVGIELLSSQTLIEGVTNYKNTLIEKDSEKNKIEIDRLESRIQLYKENIGKYINVDGKIVEIDTLNLAKKSPQQIVVLADSKVGSAAENFLLAAKQSKKVKVLGAPTSGALDYANAYFFKFGCDNYKLLLPTYRSLRLPNYPIDNIGIQPDVYIDNSVEDWVQYSIEYLEYE